ncbi:DUF4369 domain-containing protein [uncultured Polaribacter sp.]|uniref:DUF4369 domain-containing protein n=1 Tax=uncultured Polaribacter sp. TaxID=174711 RepID=UPI00261B6EDD|nr:DUF4369 domain-containing protein [uncultured Polaribacter sp.]
MKKLLILSVLAIALYACSSEKEGNMVVQGQIKGLKKGKLYLQKIKDTLLLTVDSLELKGKENFLLSDDVDSPIIYYLTLSDNNTQKSIFFFGEQGTITINDKVDKFGVSPEISGSKNQELLEQFLKVKTRFQNQKLELIKKSFDAKKENNDALTSEIDKQYQKLTKRRVLYTTNFAVSNTDSEIAPYIGLTEMYNASIKMLDTINNSLSERVKKSTYGKQFQEYVEKVKKTEEH